MDFKAYQLRLRPTHAQKRMLTRTIELCCEVYNHLQDEQIAFLLEHGRLMTIYDLNDLLPSLKEQHPEYNEVHSRTLQNLSKRVYESSEGWMDRMDRRSFKIPRHKRRSRMRSFAYSASMDFTLIGNRIHLSKMPKGDSIRFKCNQHIRGEPRTCTIVRNKNTWLCHIGCRVPEMSGTSVEDTRPVVGADLGLKTLVTLSDGTVFPRMDPEYEVMKQLENAQKHLSECGEDTPEYSKWYGRILNKHRRISDRRENYTRHVARYMADNYSKIGIEDIRVIDLIHDEVSSGLRRSQYNAGWGNLARSLCQAAKSTGTKVIPVDPFCTSQLCCGCNAYVRKDLSVRTHRCWYCGLELDRDLNASLNVLRKAVGCTASDLIRKLQDIHPRTIVFDQQSG